jgi:hypothetical protein
VKQYRNLSFPEPGRDDVEYAMALLCGIERTDERGRLPKFEFLSHNTKPTEKEARAALARVLLSGNVPRVLLWALAAAFDPGGQSPMARWNRQKAALKKFNQGHPSPERDYEVAYWVDEMRRDGRSYEDAADEVARCARISVAHVKRICGKVVLGFDPPPRARRKPSRKR